MHRWLLGFLMFTVVPAAFSAGSQGALRPVDLRCEYRANPLGIDTLAPRLSWKLEASNPTARSLRFCAQITCTY